MNLPPQIVLIGVFLYLFGSWGYIRDTLRGQTKPNRVTWLMWALAPLIGVTISWSEGATLWEGLPVFMTGFIPILILTSTFFNKESYWKLTLFDYLCGGFSLLALVFWLFVDNPTAAVALAVIADVMAGLPTIRKAWVDPKSESIMLFSFSIIDKILGLIVLDTWAFVHSGFMFAIIAQNTLIISFVLLHRAKLR